MDVSSRTRPHRRNRGATGFSLPELLIVVVVLGILAAAGLPKINRITRKEKATRALLTVQQDIERAFAITARLRKPVRMEFTASSRLYQVFELGGTTPMLTRQLDPKSDIGVNTMTATPAIIHIYPNGVADATLDVVLTGGGTTRSLSMTRVGLIRRTQ